MSCILIFLCQKPVHYGLKIPVTDVSKDIDNDKDNNTKIEDMGTTTSYRPPIPDKKKPMS